MTTFNSTFSKSIGSTATIIRTTDTGYTDTIIGLSLTNTTLGNIIASAFITRNSENYYLVQGTTIVAGGALVVVGADQKIILQAGDVLNVVSNTDTSIDVVMSFISNPI